MGTSTSNLVASVVDGDLQECRVLVETQLGISIPTALGPGASRLLGLIAGDLQLVQLEAGNPQDPEHFHPTLWLAWATLDRPDGGGLAATVEEFEDLDDHDLDTGVVQFLTWLASPIERNHPLVSHTNQYGYRSRSGPLRQGGVDHHSRAYVVWRASIGRPVACDPRAFVRMADLTQAPGPRTRFEMTVDDLRRCLAQLDACDVVTISDPIRSRAWHARETAALLVRVWGVLRAGELTELSDDLEVVDYGLRVRLFEPKTKTSRWVRLPARGDRFCPVLALERWLSIAHEAGYDRRGGLLPVVLQHRVNGSIISTGTHTERNNLRHLLTAAEVAEPFGMEDDYLLSLHNFRSVLPTLAVDAGYDLPFLQALGAWKRGSTPAQSYTAARDGMEEATLMADWGTA